MKKTTIYLIVALVVIFFGFVTAGYFLTKQDEIPVLPVYGELNEDQTEHTIADFSFTDQDNKTITQHDFNNKIYVADFFFTRCRGICPLMSNQLERVNNVFKANNEILFLSHTVKPEEDSVATLKEYATRHHAITGKWFFVTGNKKELYDMARYSYLVSLSEGKGDENDFVHTQSFTLIDKKKRIRGFYDGTDSLEVNKLIGDINTLLQEQ
jgi:protein SCO1/2